MLNVVGLSGVEVLEQLLGFAKVRSEPGKIGNPIFLLCKCDVRLWQCALRPVLANSEAPCAILIGRLPHIPKPRVSGSLVPFCWS